MTDQIPADKVRKIADWLWEDMLANGGHDEEIAPQLAARTEMAGEVRRLLLALLPLPPRPTLADMTPEERAACQWMQADVRNFDRRMVVTEVRTSSADLIERDGERWNVDLDRVTPRPDLTRLEWPGDKEPAPALPDGWRLADHKKHGRVIVTNTTPNKDGRVYVIIPAADLMGYDWLFSDPDELTYLDGDQ